MDNNFNNNQFEPEKPFTEKPNEPQPAPVFENENENSAKAVDNAGENAQQFYDEPQIITKAPFRKISLSKAILHSKRRISDSRSKTDIIKTTAADSTTKIIISRTVSL